MTAIGDNNKRMTMHGYQTRFDRAGKDYRRGYDAARKQADRAESKEAYDRAIDRLHRLNAIYDAEKAVYDDARARLA